MPRSRSAVLEMLRRNGNIPQAYGASLDGIGRSTRGCEPRPPASYHPVAAVLQRDLWVVVIHPCTCADRDHHARPEGLFGTERRQAGSLPIFWGNPTKHSPIFLPPPPTTKKPPKILFDFFAPAPSTTNCTSATDFLLSTTAMHRQRSSALANSQSFETLEVSGPTQAPSSLGSRGLSLRQGASS